jgi:hypothetical protein
VSALLVAIALLLAACSDSTKHGSAPNSPWCKTIKAHNQHFKVKDRLDRGALAEYTRIANESPPEIRPSLLTVRDRAVELYSHAAEFKADPQKAKDLFIAVAKVDNYLKRTCGVSVGIPQTRL